MKIMVSACLLGENCKYSGGNNRSEKLLRFLEGHEVVPVCPEVMGGLPTPREPAEIVNGTVISKAGVIVDKEYRLGAQRTLEIAQQESIDLAILQSRSPSCGVKQIYDGTFSGTRIQGQGVTAALLAAHGFRVMDVADL
ncbi:MAG: DUF523 domain-containing protein [Clostridia bacterium]|nr:DUF523 domain-containing protein [Clostridia bacterium]